MLLPRISTMSLVYISSTYEDLKDERNAAFEAIQRLELEARGMEGYSAQETRPIERCLEDVRECTAYLGIIGWRYGSTPVGARSSFTELEYQEAGKMGIPRFVFVASEQWPHTLRDKDPTQILAFRRQVQDAHIVREFANIDQLKFEIVAALRSLGASSPIPPLLPFQCDRDDQYEDLSAVLAAAEQDDDRRQRCRPLACVVHGHEQQALNKFMHCVKEQVPGLLDIPRHQSLSWKEVPWPSARPDASFEAVFRRRLGRALELPAVRSGAEIAARIEAIGAPTMLLARVYTDEWFPESPLALATAMRVWRDLPVQNVRWPPILFIVVEYGTNGNLLQRYWAERRNRAIRQDVLSITAQPAARRAELIRELDDVTKHHVSNWAESERVQSLVRGQDLAGDVAEVFKSCTRLPMRPLAAALRTVLKNRL